MGSEDRIESVRKRFSGMIGEPVTMEDRGGAWFVGIGRGPRKGGMKTHYAVGWGMSEAKALIVGALNYLRWTKTHAKERVGTAAAACDLVEVKLADPDRGGGEDNDDTRG